MDIEQAIMFLWDYGVGPFALVVAYFIKKNDPGMSVIIAILGVFAVIIQTIQIIRFGF